MRVALLRLELLGVSRSAVGIPLVQLLLHAHLQQHLLLSKVLLLRGGRCSVGRSWLVDLSGSLMLLVLMLLDLLVCQLLLRGSKSLVLLYFLHQDDLLLFSQVLVGG